MTASTFYSYFMLNPKVVNDLLPRRVNIHTPPRNTPLKKRKGKERRKGKNRSRSIEMSPS
jgi:hypothetical protein